ncbi:MAG: sugar phosphate isomerase/epimerase family protein [Pseudomonadales bacterium]|jgi:sugar phosphate isomerase/epimerase|nr:sugar phosphate isomerase/epimerase family protein [Pseudomonadales bacterium]MDP7357944.1 sugar phosphate isomerase/epimerase family protein [Pseudomonadales bacterium]MDP7595624.1 sugar phosphate isomerase/epimerase family protein [Pseudomonadales bacterium]HJN49628.1 sugar phosphate isomerase/epimerase family protein [Pseudomonadales bacterium]|tara:strand:- start:2164 stop:3219 length:1056 start_codon:yes stop_codon:yes gene_type:complete
MKTIKGPAIFLQQFISDEEPFNHLENISEWAAGLGYRGIQLPIGDARFLDIDLAAESKDYCDAINGEMEEMGIQVTELASHLEGQLVAVNPSFNELFDGFAPPEVKGNPSARTEWATGQLIKAAKASANLGLKAHATFSGALLWHTFYPWPQRPDGLVELGFRELAKRWTPILDAFEEAGVDLCYEIHPGEDLHDGVTYERFLAEVNNHPRANLLYDPSHFVLQQLDYLSYIDIYHERIKMFHVKDAEFNPTGRSGVYGGYQNWVDRPGRFRSLGDGQVDFNSIFSKLAHNDFDGWAVLEWECCLKDSAVGAIEGAQFIAEYIIEVTTGAFDDFASADTDENLNMRLLGLD